MISAGICVIHIYSAVVFKVLYIDINGILLLPYRKETKMWDKENITRLHPSSVNKIHEVQCPRARRDDE